MLGLLNNKFGIFGRGVFFTGISTFFSKIFILLVTVFLARTIEKDLFGQFGLVKSFVDSFALYSTFGMGITATRFISDNKKNESVITNLAFFIISVSSFLLIFVGFVFADEFISEILNNSISKNIFYILLITLYFSAIYNLLLGKNFGLLNYSKVFKFQVFLSFLIFLSVITTVYYDISFLLYSIPISYFVFVVFTFNKQIRIKNLVSDVIDNKNILVDLFHFGWPVFLASCLTAPVLWYIQSLYSVDVSKMSELGVYSSLYIIPGFLASISVVINNALMPIIFKYESKKNDIINILSGITCLYILGVFIFLIKEYLFVFVKVDYVKDYVDAFIIQITTIIVMTYRQGFGRLVLKEKKNILSLLSMTQWSLTLIVLQTYFFDLSAYGLSLSLFISYVINDFFYYIFLLKLFKIKLPSFFKKSLLAYFVCIFSLAFQIHENVLIKYTFLFLSLIFYFIIIINVIQKNR